MLCYKTWLETRWIFLTALLVLLFVGSATVLNYPRYIQGQLHDLARKPAQYQAALQNFPAFARAGFPRRVAGGFEKIALLWTIFAVILGTGGLLKEKVAGTAPFLLSMPVSRRLLVAARFAVGFAEAAAMALAGFLTVPLLAPLVGERYPAGEALAHSVFLAAAGVFYVAFGILISTVMEGARWPAVIGASLAFLTITIESSRMLARFSPFPLLSGEVYFRLGSVPWTGISTSIAMAAAMLGFALWVVKWQDF